MQAAGPDGPLVEPKLFMKQGGSIGISGIGILSNTIEDEGRRSLSGPANWFRQDL